MTRNVPAGRAAWRHRWHEIIFESDTRAGKWFDVGLLVAIGLSVLVVMLESVVEIRRQHGDALMVAEWFFTALFSVEYVMRLLTVDKPLRYATSFYGIVDLLAIVPTPIGLVIPRAHTLSVVRIIRVLRVFRVLKLVYYLNELRVIGNALYASRRKIAVFLLAVLTVVVTVGSMMYVIEGGRNGFTSIPKSIYWAVVTLTTVGYGDVAPATPLGQGLAALIMMLGYCVLAVPTGIVSVELVHATERSAVSGQACPSCSAEGHAIDAKHCKYCGARL